MKIQVKDDSKQYDVVNVVFSKEGAFIQYYDSFGILTTTDVKKVIKFHIETEKDNDSVVFSLLNFVDSEVPIENITRKTFKHVIDYLMDRYIEK